jgi:hypothetical protein
MSGGDFNINNSHFVECQIRDEYQLCRANIKKVGFYNTRIWFEVARLLAQYLFRNGRQG